MPMRRGPGIVKTAARTAVVAGTATATVGVVHHAMGGGKQPAAPPQPAPAAPPTSSDRITQLNQLAQLRASGALTEEEFQREKQKLLAS